MKPTNAERFRLPIKVVPGSSRSAIAGWLGDALKVRVAAPAERGKANAAVESLVSQALGLPGGSVRIVSGSSSARKILEISGLSESEARRRFSARMASEMAGTDAGSQGMSSA